MRVPIKLRLGKKDEIIKQWWTCTVSSGETASYLINYLVLYYKRTGEYYKLGTIKDENKTTEDSLIKVYLDEKSEVYLWLKDKKEEPISTIIKRILRNSVSFGPETRLISYDKLVADIEFNKQNNELSPTWQITSSPQIKKNELEIANTEKAVDLRVASKFMGTEDEINDEDEDDPFTQLLGKTTITL